MRPQRRIRIALIGAESFRGKELKTLLERKKLPIDKIEFFDPNVEEEFSKLTDFQGEPRVIMPLNENALADFDFVFLASEKKTNRKFGNLAAKKKFIAIDLSESFNSDENVPIVVAGVNHEVVLEKNPALVANPHPVTIILAHFSHVIAERFKPKRITAFVLQPASAFEMEGITELADQSFAVLNSATVAKKTFKAQVAFNLVSDIDSADKDGFSSSEKQILSETKSVLGYSDLPLSVAVVQVPVFHTYSIMFQMELEERTDIPTIVDLFKRSPYFKVATPSPSRPVSSLQAAGRNEIYIGQIKKEDSMPTQFWIWTVTDNLTRGSAVNAFEIFLNSILRSHTK